MPSDLRPFEAVSDALVLAAIDRAERHGQVESVQRSRIAEHLGFVPGALTTVRLGPQVDALIAAGAVRRSRRHGSKIWGLTSDGRNWLARAREEGEPLELPEAPQHRRWRQARANARERIDALREEVRHSLTQAQKLLDDKHGQADAWVKLSTQLQRQCAQLGSATYCLHEWPEPDDARADVDEAHRHLRQLNPTDVGYSPPRTQVARARKR